MQLTTPAAIIDLTTQNQIFFRVLDILQLATDPIGQAIHVEYEL